MPATNHTRTQVRALVWEEVRTGGVIAVACTLVGLSLLIWGRILTGEAAWERDDFLTKFAAFWLPLIVAFLLVLNPDYSGHLTGGFSKRILRFPVTTRLVVAVSLMSRTLLVGVTATLLLGSARLLFDGTPGLELVFVVIGAYLLVQIVDWLRGLVSGLTSLVVIGAVSLAIVWLNHGARLFDSEEMRALAGLSFKLPLSALVAGVLSYLFGVLIVRANRAGRRYGIPEIWEWPRRLSLPALASRSKFRSALGAQVWFEVRRSKFAIPVVCLMVFLIHLAVAWFLGQSKTRSWEQSDLSNLSTTLGLLVGLLLGAIAHGIQTRVIGFRGGDGKPGYEYLQPLTDAQFALARVIAAALMLLPTLAVALVIHFSVAGRVFTTEFVPEAYRLGMSSPREVAWMFLGRGLLAGGLAWMLIGIGTRLFQWAAAIGFAVFVLAGISDVYADTDLLEQGNAFVMVITAGLVVATVVLAAHALYSGQLSRRLAMFWLVVWAGLAWLLHYPLISQWVLAPVPLSGRLSVILTSLGAASIVPLLFLSVLRDVFRRRHPTAEFQEPAPAALQPSRRLRRPAFVVPALALAAAVLWMGWPATPSYVAYRHQLGYPVTLAGLDAFYVAPAEDRNPASELLALDRERVRRISEYASWFRENKHELFEQEKSDAFTGLLHFENFVYIVGREPLPDSGPLPAGNWRATASYWERVTSTLAARLRDLVQQDAGRARFEIDLRDGYNVRLDHLAPLRMLGRELQLDALHAVMVGQPDRAIDDVAAGFALADSLRNEPLLISQLVRIAILDQALGTAEIILNRSTLSDTQLLRLQTLLGGFDEPGLRESFRGGFIGESMITLDIVDRYDLVADTMENAWPNPLTLANRLAYPVDAQRAGVSLAFNHVIGLETADSRSEIQRRDSQWSEKFFNQMSQFMSPAAAILMPAYGRSWEAVLRISTRFDTIRVTVAIERYRLANNRIPESLDDLVPAFLPEVPRDKFDPDGGSLQYAVSETGEYTVYSVGRDGIDPFGRFPDEQNRSDNLATRVAPPLVRAGPQTDEK